jgi:hypothetical protein
MSKAINTIFDNVKMMQKAFWIAPSVITVFGVILLLYNYFVFYIPGEIEADKIASAKCVTHALGCTPIPGPDYWTWYSIVGWVMILIGIAIGISYFYIHAIFPRQNAAS